MVVAGGESGSRLRSPRRSFSKIASLCLGFLLVAWMWFLLIDGRPQMDKVTKNSNKPSGFGSSSSSRQQSLEHCECSVPPSKVVIDAKELQAWNSTRREELKTFTSENAARWFTKEAGQEHYALMEYLVAKYGSNEGCRKDCHVVDIGTRYVASALALGSHHELPVWTFDIPKSGERRAAFRGKTEEEWQAQVYSSGVRITFHNLDLLKISDKDFAMYMDTWLVSLDTFHQPDTVPFEREFFERFVKMGTFKGIMMLDDIHLNAEMKKWWKEVQGKASSYGYTAHDVTFVGHFSGTGLLDFSRNRVEVRGSR